MLAKYNNNKLGRCVVIALCVLGILGSCGDDRDADKRTPEAYKLLRAVSDSIFTMSPSVVAVCDSVLNTTADSFEYYDYYMLKGRYYLMARKQDTALAMARRTMLFASGKKPSLRINGLLGLAYSAEASYHYIERQQPDKVIEYNKKAHDLLLKSDMTDLTSDVAANLADGYVLKSDMPNAAKWYRRALFLVDSLNLPRNKDITLYLGLGQIYTAMQDYDTAKLYYELTEKRFEQMQPNMQLYFLNNFGNYYYYTHNYTEALRVFKKLHRHIIRYYGDNNDKPDMSVCNINLADVYLNLGDTDKAKLYLKKSEGFFIKKQIHVGIFYANTIKIGIALKERNYNAIERILKTEPELTVTEHNIVGIRNKYVQEYYERTGNYRKALSVYKDNIAQNDSLEHNKVKMRASEIMMRFSEDTLRLHHKLAIEEKNAIVERAHTATWFFVSVAMVLTFTIICFIIQGRKKKLQNHIDIILLRLANARQRISPHFVFNVLNARMSTARKEEADMLLSLARLIRTNLDMTANPCITLREEMNFVNQFVDLQRMLVGDDFRYDVNIADDSILDNGRIPAMFIQILVENSFKHARRKVKGYKTLKIDIAEKDELFVVSITDNGPGFDIRDNEGQTSKNGLNIIRQTLAIINHENKGKCKMRFFITNIEDADGHIAGCRASYEIPKQIRFI